MVTFKTKEPFFTKEYNGTKCNTVRDIGQNDNRFEELMYMLQTKSYGMIKIFDPESKREFHRQITDVTYWDERFIISWKHKGVQG